MLSKRATEKLAAPPSPGIAPAVLDDTTPAPETFSDGFPLPKLLVFDLDYTLWPFWCDTHVQPPLKAKEGNSRAVDRWGESFAFYSDVPQILHAARGHSLRIAAASRTSSPEIARDLLKLFHVPPSNKKAVDFFEYLQIFPGSKTTHFERLQKQTGLPYEEMLFFDDEIRNKNVEALGVVMCLVRDGITRGEIDRGIREWRQRNGRKGGSP